MRNKIVKIAEMVLLAVTFPLWFVKLFVDVGYLLNQDGDVVKVVFRYSMYENICDIAPCLAYIAMAIGVFAIVWNMATLRSGNKKLQIVSHIVFGVAIVGWIMLLLNASAVARGY